MRPAGWCQPKGRIGAAPGATEPMGERGKCLYTLKNTSKSRRSAQNTKKSISNSNNEPNFTLHEISGLGTRFTMEEDFYKGRLARNHGLKILVPTKEKREIINRVIYNELCRGNIEQESKKRKH